MKKLIFTLFFTLATIGLLTGCQGGIQRSDVGLMGGGVAGGFIGNAITGGSTLGTISGTIGGAYLGRAVAKNVQ
jgi:osmotically inducible lipoprotein OsmB